MAPRPAVNDRNRDKSPRSWVVVFLIAAVQAFLVSFPSLVLSITLNSDKDAGLKLVFPPKEMARLSDPASLAKLLNETVSMVVTLFSFGYYRIYADGPSNQRLFLFLGGLSKLGAACILVSWYLHGHATSLLLLLGVVPEICFGSYFLATWWGLEPSMPPIASSIPKFPASRAAGPRNWVFGVAAAQLLFMASSSLVLSLTDKTLELDSAMKLVMDNDSLALVSAPGLTRDMFRMFNWLLVCFGLGYARVFIDGSAYHPLLVFIGAVGKLATALLFLLSKYGSKIEFVIIGILPDLLFGSYFFKVWVDMGSIFAPPKGKQM